MSTSRTKHVSKNLVISGICQAINLLLSFISRSVFIHQLGTVYLGINGLFTNILTILSFAELGIGNAIVYNMYRPLAEGDNEKLKSLMDLYKKAYRIILVIISIAGLCVVPFLNLIIKTKIEVEENLTVLYLLFLCHTAISYVLAYKKAIITADQKNYIVVIVTQLAHSAQVVFQIVFLFLTRNFILFLILQIVFTLLGNVICSIVSNRLYPFLKTKAIPLGKKETGQIFKNVRDLSFYKFGSVILNGTDNILVSALVGVSEVGLVSNYVLLHNACNSVLGIISASFTASIGNLNVNSTAEKKYEIFNKYYFITAWLYGFAGVGLVTVSNYLIPVWLGKEYILDELTVIAIVLGFYVQGVHAVETTFRTTLGYFKQGRFAPLFSAIFNIILSIVLCKVFGLAGIFIATPVARFSFIGIVDTLLLYKREFNKKPIIYCLMSFGYLALFGIITLICKLILYYLNFQGWVGVCSAVIIVTFVYNIIMIIIFCRTETFKGLIKYLKLAVKPVVK